MTDEQVKRIARTFVDTASQIRPSRKRAEDMHMAFEDMRQFMKTGEGSKKFDCTLSGAKVKLTRVEGGVMVELGDRSAVVAPEEYDVYIDRLHERYKDVDKIPLNRMAAQMLSNEVMKGFTPNGIIRIANIPLRRKDVVRIAEWIDRLTEEGGFDED